jgi:hypothetical protein
MVNPRLRGKGSNGRLAQAQEIEDKTRKRGNGAGTGDSYNGGPWW